jgi:branched-chain amino acid transport system substrate-binding protein
MSIRLNRAPALIAALTLLLTAAPVSAPGADEPPVVIDALISVTGPAAFFGGTYAKALTVLEETTNAGGGIAGRKVHFNILDDASNPQTAVQLTNDLIARKRPAVLGPILTVTCQAMMPLVERSGPVSYCGSPLIAPSPGSYVFAASSTGDDMMAVVLRFFRLRGMKRVAVLNTPDATGQAIDKALDAAFVLPENKSVTMVGREYYGLGDVSVTAQLSKLKAQRPDALISWAVGSPYGTVLRSMNDTGLDIPVITGAGNETVGQMTQYASFLPKHVYFTGGLGTAMGGDVPHPVAAAQVTFAKAFQSAGLVADGSYAGMWDLALIYLDAYKHFNGNPTANDVHTYLEQLRGFPGVNGIYDFRANAQRGLGQNGDIITQWDPAKKAFTPAAKPGGYR